MRKRGKNANNKFIEKVKDYLFMVQMQQVTKMVNILGITMKM